MSTDKDSLFSKERVIVKSAENLLKNSDIPLETLLGSYRKLLKGYKKLLRHATTLTRVSDNQQRKLNTLLERLGRYVSFQLFKKIAEEKDDNEIKARRTKLTVFFSDLKDFSYTASHLEGETLSEFLNSYLETMTKIVIKWGGTLDKYMGDAIMVFFGDPEFISDKDHAIRCVKMAIEMREQMKGLRKKWYKMGYQEPLHSRMGIATGYCTVGNFGSSERMDYTIIGSPVNLASRLETAADVDEIFISHETWGYINDEIICDAPLTLNLKGFHQQIIAHKVLYLKGNDNNDVFCILDEIRGENIEIDFSSISKNELIRIIKLQETLKYRAIHDLTTGLMNREAILKRLEVEMSRSERESNALGVALIEIDTLHRIEQSDAVLEDVVRKIAEIICTAIRDYDICGRFDESVFILISPGTGIDTIPCFFDRIRKSVENKKILVHGHQMRMTVSVGGTCYEKKITLESLLQAVEAALSKARKKGGNNVECIRSSIECFNKSYS
ncbi:adenylate/guanylate cyclase domain-containing protein [Desulfobacterales bacterium HSG16]|nr:adenylate/guanylate cyclase domain-containing protein [Desulfobacterales bacterium HSG16]